MRHLSNLQNVIDRLELSSYNITHKLTLDGYMDSVNVYLTYASKRVGEL